MAVTDLFLTGTVTSATTTIQPASGTVYSFKRGNVTSSDVGTNNTRIRTGNLDWYFGNATTRFTNLAFSESGVFITQGSATAAVNANSIPFVAVSNALTVGVAADSGITTNYTLVGVSMT